MLTYARQTSEATLQVHVDTDLAGDLLGTKSTTEVIVRRGKHLLRHMPCEDHALIRGACTSLGIQSCFQDCMIDDPIYIYSDSSAARRVARRRGIGGRLRHMQTLVAAEPSGCWSLEVGCRVRRAEPSRHAHETTARSQHSRVVRTCWSKMVAAIVTTTTTNDGKHHEGCLVMNILMD